MGNLDYSERYEAFVDRLYGLRKAAVVAAAIGVAALFIPDWGRKQEPEKISTFRGVETVARTATVKGVPYKITNVADAYLQHGFHRMRLCGRDFTKDQMDEILLTTDSDKDGVIVGWEAGNTFDMVLNPLHALGQRMLPLEKRVRDQTIERYPQWYALAESLERKYTLDIVLR